jgi:hypothetical protein
MKYLFVVALLLFASNCFADFYTVGGTEKFNTSLGTLNKVSVRFKQDNVSMSVADHTHTITSTSVNYSLGTNSTASLEFSVISLAGGGAVTTSTVGDHLHSVTPSFTWNGKNISLTSVNSTSAGSHAHGVTGLKLFGDSFSGSGIASISGGTIQNGGAHSQTFSFDQTVDFTGSDLSLFLGPTDPDANYSGSFSVNGSNHTHVIASGAYTVQVDNLGVPQQFNISILSDILLSSTSTGNHSVNLNGNAFETTFEFTPFSSVPEPSSFVLLSVVAGAGAFGRRFWKKRKQA